MAIKHWVAIYSLLFLYLIASNLKGWMWVASIPNTSLGEFWMTIAKLNLEGHVTTSTLLDVKVNLHSIQKVLGLSCAQGVHLTTREPLGGGDSKGVCSDIFPTQAEAKQPGNYSAWGWASAICASSFWGNATSRTSKFIYHHYIHWFHIRVILKSLSKLMLW